MVFLPLLSQARRFLLVSSCYDGSEALVGLMVPAERSGALFKELYDTSARTLCNLLGHQGTWLMFFKHVKARKLL